MKGTDQREDECCERVQAAAMGAERHTVQVGGADPGDQQQLRSRGHTGESQRSSTGRRGGNCTYAGEGRHRLCMKAGQQEFCVAGPPCVEKTGWGPLCPLLMASHLAYSLFLFKSTWFFSSLAACFSSHSPCSTSSQSIAIAMVLRGITRKVSVLSGIRRSTIHSHLYYEEGELFSFYTPGNGSKRPSQVTKVTHSPSRVGRGGV